VHAINFAWFVQTYGYPAVFAGSFLEGETLLALGGLAAHRGYLALPWVIAVATVGAFLGDQLYFWLGRRFGPQLLARWPGLAPSAARVARLLERYDFWFVPGLRFVYGLRVAGVVALGMTRIGALRFLALNLAGAVGWAALVGGLGYAAGGVLERLLGDLGKVEQVLFAAVAVAGLVAAILGRIRRRRRPGKGD